MLCFSSGYIYILLAISCILALNIRNGNDIEQEGAKKLLLYYRFHCIKYFFCIF